MGTLLTIIGIAVAVMGYASAISALETAESALHQAVVAVWSMHGTLGLILAGVGLLVSRSGAKPPAASGTGWQDDPSDNRPYRERLADWKAQQHRGPVQSSRSKDLST